MKGYDKISVNHGMLLDLPLLEGSGVITRDVAKPHHDPITLEDPGTGSFNWTTLVSGLPCLEFVRVGPAAGEGVYLECDVLDTADLDFTSGDYSIGGWIKWIDTGVSILLIGRYELSLTGWELYLWSGILQLRHHHASFCPGTCPPDFERTGASSTGWTAGTWEFFGVSRSGAYPIMYRNGVPLTMAYSPLGIHDPDPCNMDLVIGTRYTKDMDWYSGLQSRPRVWGRSLSEAEWKGIFESEKHWYGVI